MSAREALAGFFQSVADSFADMVAKMIAEYLKMALIKGIMSLIPGLGAVAGGLGGGGESLGASSSAVFGLNSADMNQYSSLMPMANGGVLSGGFQAFANGGIVTGPTLGLVGEGRYNEAVIPLPDGKSVPVDLGGAMGNQITSNIVVNVISDGKTSSSGAVSDSAGLGRKIEGAVKQVIVGELRPGGLLAGRR
jgi:phage-related minor tail protein